MLFHLAIPEYGRFCGQSMLFHLAIREYGRFCGFMFEYTMTILVLPLFLRMGWSFCRGHPCFTAVFEDGKPFLAFFVRILGRFSGWKEWFATFVRDFGVFPGRR